MGLISSKINPIVAPDFDGETSDYTTEAENYTHPFGPEWVTNIDEIKNSLSELDNIPTGEIPLFSFRGALVPAFCTKCYDGDTCHFVMKYNGEWVKYRFRMLGYNSPEIRSENAEERAKAILARDYLANRLLNKKVLLYLGDFDKYGRPLCDVYLIEGPIEAKTVFKTHINREMIKMGHGAPYMPRELDNDPFFEETI